MSWTNIPNANLQVGAPLRSVDILALRDNVSAVPNGNAGAPRIKAAALDGGQSGAAPIYAARAWVNFDATGTVAIRASGNVSSITDNATGDYTVNFATAMPDANYCATATASSQISPSSSALCEFGDRVITTSGIRLATRSFSGARIDPADVFVAIHR